MTAVSSIAAARAVFFITFFYRRERLRYLYWVLRNIGEIPCLGTTIHIFTHSDIDHELASISSLAEQILNKTIEIRIHTVDVVHNPQSLTWAHKDMLRTERAANRYDYYVYLEDDIRFSFANLAYFLERREELRPHGLIPGFLRIEYQFDSNALHWADNTEISVLTPQGGQRFFRSGDVTFVSHKFPYAAMFVFDNDLCDEHLASDSSHIDRSRHLSSWNISERAAMGLTWDRIPESFVSRLVVPIDNVSGHLLPACLVDHLPSNYANSERADLLGYYRLRDSLVLSECDNPAHPTIADLTGNRWRFGPVGRSDNGEVAFRADGRFVAEHPNRNEFSWELSQNILRIFDEDSDCAWTFVFRPGENHFAVGKSAPKIGCHSFQIVRLPPGAR